MGNDGFAVPPPGRPPGNADDGGIHMTAASIVLECVGGMLQGFLMEDGTVQAYDPVSKTMLTHPSAIAWLQHWRDSH